MIDEKKDNRIIITKGDTMAWNIKFTNISEDLTDAYFTVKETADGSPVIQKTLNAGITKVDDREYKNEKTYKLQLQAEDSVYLEANMQYLYDIKVAIGNVVKTILSGIFIAKESITGASSIIVEFAEIDAVDLLETEFATAPATSGIEYEQDPIACAKIGDMSELDTQATGTLVDAINEVNTKASNAQDDLINIENGDLVVPEAQHAVTADSATNATNADNADNATEAEYASSDHTKGTIEQRLTALGFSQTAISVAGISSRTLTIERQGNYVKAGATLGTLTQSQVNNYFAYGQIPFSLPAGYRPATATPITLYIADVNGLVGFTSRGISATIGTDGDCIINGTTGGTLTGSRYNVMINFGFEAPART